MSVSSTTRKQQFVLDGIEDDYTFTFRALTSAPEDIKCSVKTAGVTTVLTYTTQYSVAINSEGVGGTVTLVSAGTIGLGTLTVYRETTNTQESDYDDYNQFPANTLEEDLDKRTMVDQEQTETFDRTIKLPIESTLTGLELPDPEAGKALKWNAAATSLINSTVNIENIDTAVAEALASQLAAATYATTALTHSNTALEYAQVAQTASATALSSLTIQINLQTRSYTVALADANKMIDLNSSGTINLTIPSSGAVNLETGSVIFIRQLGAGQVVITTSATVTVRAETGLKISGQYGVAALLKTSSDEWQAVGALES
ncbi:MAG: hypothetical protein WC332_01665 [Clostridia bacterium]|jgi:hypothetical protein